MERKLTPAPNKKIIEKINDLEERIEDVKTQKENDDYYCLWEMVDKIMVEIYALKRIADKNENTVVIYGVKLADKTSEEITVDGITITDKLKRIKEKTKALEELEKEGVIIIEESNYSALQDARDRLAANISYSAFQDARLGFQAMLTKPANFLNPAFRDLRVKFEAMCSRQAFKDSQVRLASMLMNPALQDMKHATILSGPTSQDARERLATILSDALMELKREIKPHTEPGTKKEQNIIEQKPISTEITKIIERINDLEEHVKTQKDDYYSLWETVKKIIIESESDTGTSIIRGEIESEKKMLPKSESQIEKIPWNGSKSQLRRLFKALKNERLLDNIEYLEFVAHFEIKSEAPYQEIETDKIRWIGTIRQLVYLNKLLIDRGLFDKEKKHKRLADNFKDKNGNDLNPIHLCNSYKGFDINPTGRRYDQIRNVVKLN